SRLRVSARTPAFSQVRLKRRRANSNGSVSRTLTLGMESPGLDFAGLSRGEPPMIALPDRPAQVHCLRAGVTCSPCAPILVPMRVLGIETSCDETGVAVYDTAIGGAAGLRAQAVYSQIALHAEYGGVVPELASRDHVRKLVPLIRQTLAEAGMGVDDLDGVAYTAGPGLVGALLVGAGVARSLAWALEVPALGVHHMEGHLLAPLMEDDPPRPPFVALLVSGGHT